MRLVGVLGACFMFSKGGYVTEGMHRLLSECLCIISMF